MNRNQHLQDVLESHRMKHVQKFVDKMTKRKDEIATFLKDEYGSDAYDTFNSGSMAKHTATNIKFDMDIVIPFKHEAFDTLQAMYDDVYDKLYDKYKDDAEEVRKQKVSIGVSFKKEDGDDKAVEIDVVPGRETSTDSSFHVYDPGNGNNDVIAAMTDSDRRALKTDMDTMLMNIESNDEYFLPYYFPINMKYFNGYKEKKEGSPYPTSPKRFGR